MLVYWTRPLGASGARLSRRGEAVRWAPQPDLESIRVPPGYAHAVVEAWRQGLVTRVRAVELMHGQVSEADLPDRAETWAPENVSSARRVFWPQLSADRGRPLLMTGKQSRSPASGQSLVGVVTRTD